MEAIEAIRTRKSIRAYKPDPVSKDILTDILDAARWAPSACNSQCWYFSVLGGATIEKVKDRLVEKAMESEFNGTTFNKMNPDFPRACSWPESSDERRNALRTAIDTTMFPPGTENIDEKRAAWMGSLLRFCEAPNVIMVWTRDSCPTGLIDIGTATQSICLAAHAYGLGTVPMQLPTFWPEIFYEEVGTSKDLYLAIAIAIGYPDMEARVNNVPRDRELLENLVEWHGV